MKLSLKSFEIITRFTPDLTNAVSLIQLQQGYPLQQLKKPFAKAGPFVKDN